MVSIISCCFTGGFLLKIALYLWKDERERAGKRTRCLSSAWAPEGGLEDSAVPSPTSTFPELLCSVFRLWEGCGSSLLLRVFKSCDFYSPLTPPRPPSLPPSSFFVSLKSSLSIAGSYLDSNHLFLKLIPMKSALGISRAKMWQTLRLFRVGRCLLAELKVLAFMVKTNKETKRMEGLPLSSTLMGWVV